MTRLEIAAHVARTNTLLESIAASQERTEQHLAAQNGRIRKLETAQTETRTKLRVYAAIGGSVGLLVISDLLRHFIK